jgi:hypothetical protein
VILAGILNLAMRDASNLLIGKVASYTVRTWQSRRRELPSAQICAGGILASGISIVR